MRKIITIIQVIYFIILAISLPLGVYLKLPIITALLAIPVCIIISKNSEWSLFYTTKKRERRVSFIMVGATAILLLFVQFFIWIY